MATNEGDKSRKSVSGELLKKLIIDYSINVNPIPDSKPNPYDFFSPRVEVRRPLIPHLEINEDGELVARSQELAKHQEIYRKPTENLVAVAINRQGIVTGSGQVPYSGISFFFTTEQLKEAVSRQKFEDRDSRIDYLQLRTRKNGQQPISDIDGIVEISFDPEMAAKYQFKSRDLAFHTSLTAGDLRGRSVLGLLMDGDETHTYQNVTAQQMPVPTIPNRELNEIISRYLRPDPTHIKDKEVRPIELSRPLTDRTVPHQPVLVLRRTPRASKQAGTAILG